MNVLSTSKDKGTLVRRPFEKHGDQSVKAILFLVLYMSFTPLNDALIKLMSERLPLAEIVAIGALIPLGILFGFMTGFRSIAALHPMPLGRFIIRVMCLLAAIYIYIVGVARFHNLFNSQGSLFKRSNFKLNRDAALTEWRTLIAS